MEHSLALGKHVKEILDSCQIKVLPRDRIDHIQFQIPDEKNYNFQLVLRSSSAEKVFPLLYSVEVVAISRAGSFSRLFVGENIKRASS